jgi:hypothetical protein
VKKVKSCPIQKHRNCKDMQEAWTPCSLVDTFPSFRGTDRTQHLRSRWCCRLHVCLKLKRRNILRRRIACTSPAWWLQIWFTNTAFRSPDNVTVNLPPDNVTGWDMLYHLNAVSCLLNQGGRPCASDSLFSCRREPVPGSHSLQCENTQQRSGTKWMISGHATNNLFWTDSLRCGRV